MTSGGAVALSVKVQNLRFCGTPLYRYIEFAGIHTDPSFASEGTASPKLAVRSDDRTSQTGGLSGCRSCSPHDLSSAWREVDAPDSIPETGDKYWVHTLKTVFEELEALGLSKPIPKPEPRKRGRPRKNPVDEKPKRKRGRPRKNP